MEVIFMYVLSFTYEIFQVAVGVLIALIVFDKIKKR